MSDEMQDEAQSEEPEVEVGEFEQLVRDVEDDPGCASFPRLAEAYRRDGQVVLARQIAEEGLALAPERLGGRVALALAQLDMGDIAEATRGLASILENIPSVPGAVASAKPVDATIESSEESEEPEEEIRAEHRLYSTPPETTPLAQPSELLPQVDLEQQGEDSSHELREDEIDDAFEHAEAEADQMLSPNDVAEAAMLDADVPDRAEPVPLPETVASDDPNEPYSAVEHPVFATETMANLLEGQGDTAAAAAIRSSIPGYSTASEMGNEIFAYSSGGGPTDELDGVTDELDPATDDAVVQHIDDAREERRARIIRRLEGWLANIRRDVA